MLNGPNLGRLGTRQVDVYGLTSYADLVTLCVETGRELGLDVVVRQTDAEHEMLGWLHARGRRGRGGGAQPGGLVALLDTRCGTPARCCADPLVEVHISNIHAREEFRHHSVVSAVATGVICGLGVDGYRLALRHLATRLAADLHRHSQ